MAVPFDKIKALFLAALDHAAPADRAAYLDEACGTDAALRRSVEALLRVNGQADPLLDRSAVEHLEGVSGEAAVPDETLPFLDPSARPDSLGRIGHYEVLAVIGHGGFGIVLRAFDDRLQRVVAIKVLDPQLAATSPARKRFLREAQASAMIRHENVVQVYAVEEQPLPYLVMEYIPGETLQQRLDRRGPLDAAEVVQIGRQIAEGLAAAHATGLVHRDIKPANLLIEAGPQQRVKITDFGLARAADDASMTQSGLVAGTPMYMSPEQASGDALDHRADLFSLGSVLYTMCAGRPPFRANNALAVLKRVADDTPRPIAEIIPEVPRWLCDLIARLHAKKPEDRIATASEVADLLARGAEGTLPTALVPSLAPAAPTTPEKTPRRWPSPRRWAAAAAVLLALLAGLSFTEATGITDFRGTVIRLFSPEGTLVVEVDDPGVTVRIDGSDLVITGAGAKEIRLKPGAYTVEASKDGKVVSRELVSVAKNGKQVVRVRQEATLPETKAAAVAVGAAEWERSVAALPAEEQAKAVGARLREVNAGFRGEITRPGRSGLDVDLAGAELRDLSPVRALPVVRTMHVSADNLTDLSPLRGMALTRLDLCTGVTDLSPLQGMVTLRNLDLTGSMKVKDLSPLRELPLELLTIAATTITDLSPLRAMKKLAAINCDASTVEDLSPLKGMPLKWLHLRNTKVSDLSPLKGMPLKFLRIDLTPVANLSPLAGMPLEHLWCDFDAQRDAKLLRAITTLETINGQPAAAFWREVEAKAKK